VRFYTKAERPYPFKRCSSHSTGIPRSDRRTRRRALRSLRLLGSISTAGTFVSRLKRLVSATNGHSFSGLALRSYSQRVVKFAVWHKGKQRTEDGSQRTEIRSQRSEVRVKDALPFIKPIFQSANCPVPFVYWKLPVSTSESDLSSDL